jgi:hypothetical protein
LALDWVRSKLIALLKNYPQLKDSSAHKQLYEILSHDLYPSCILLSSDKTKLDSAIDHADYKNTTYLYIITSLCKGRGGPLLAYLLKEKLKPNSSQVLSIASLDDQLSSYRKNIWERSIPSEFYEKFGFPSKPKGGLLTITHDKLKPYALEKIKALKTTDLEDPFALPHNLDIGDGNDYSKLESV